MAKVFLVRVLLIVCAMSFAACLAAQATRAMGWFVSPSLYAVLFIILFAISAITGLLQFRIELIEREWPFFTFESYRTLFRKFPLWLALLSGALLSWVVVAPTYLRIGEQAYVLLAAIFALEGGALASLHRQPWLLKRLTCQNGHEINHFNRFCPTCGECLPRLPGST